MLKMLTEKECRELNHELELIENRMTQKHHEGINEISYKLDPDVTKYAYDILDIMQDENVIGKYDAKSQVIYFTWVSGAGKRNEKVIN